MKFRTTRKAIVNNYATIISAGYCELQHLLSTRNPIAYTCGVYGWNFDLYDVGGVAICTGYRGMPGKRAKNTREYEDRARAICEDRTLSYEARRAAIRALLEQFVAQAR